MPGLVYGGGGEREVLGMLADRLSCKRDVWISFGTMILGTVILATEKYRQRLTAKMRRVAILP